jgi:DNA-binding MarR family transcriptional regulator
MTKVAARRSLSWSISRLARQLEHALDDEGLTLAQFRVLSLLTDGRIAAGVVADWLAVSPPSVTSVVQGLVTRGYAERSEPAGDRRRLDIVITEAGRRAVERAEARGDAMLRDLAAGIGPAAGSLLESTHAWGEALDLAREARLAGTGQRASRATDR